MFTSSWWGLCIYMETNMSEAKITRFVAVTEKIWRIWVIACVFVLPTLYFEYKNELDGIIPSLIILVVWFLTLAVTADKPRDTPRFYPHAGPPNLILKGMCQVEGLMALIISIIATYFHAWRLLAFGSIGLFLLVLQLICLWKYRAAN